MKVIFILAALVALLAAQKPNCFVHPDKKLEKIYLMPSERQAYNLGEYFEGYNLKYSAQSIDNTTFDLIDPFYVTNIAPLPQNLTSSIFLYMQISL